MKKFQLEFLCNSYLQTLCAPDKGDAPATDRLIHNQFGKYRFEWSSEQAPVEVHLPHGELVRLLHGTGFWVEALVRIQAAESERSRPPHRASRRQRSERMFWGPVPAQASAAECWRGSDEARAIARLAHRAARGA